MLGRQVVYSALISGRSITLGLSMIENIQTLNLLWYLRILIESLSNSVFERRTSTGSEVFSLTICLDAKKLVLISFFSLMRTIYLRVSTKLPSNDAKRPLPVDVCRSKTLLLKLPNGQATSLWQCSYFVGGLIINAKLPYLKYDCSLAVSGYSRVFIPAIIYFITFQHVGYFSFASLWICCHFKALPKRLRHRAISFGDVCASLFLSITIRLTSDIGKYLPFSRFRQR